jgi:hypothetical protein
MFKKLIKPKKPHIPIRSAPLESKVMLRVYSGEQKGATAFFRNRPLLATLTKLFENYPQKKINILFHACSIGAEPYSLAIQLKLSGITKKYQIKIDATDLNADFVQIAKNGCYDSSVINTATAEEAKFFDKIDNNVVRVNSAIRKMVNFLAPRSFVDAKFKQQYDFVFVTNALTYVTETQQSQTIANIAGYNAKYLIVTAFHPDTIKADIIANGYEPVLENLEDIHNNWQERFLSEELLVKGKPEYSFGLTPFSQIQDYEYKYCAVFKKKN